MEQEKDVKNVEKPTRQQLLKDPDIKPTDDVIAKALGEANHAYEKFLMQLASHEIQLKWRYYTDGKAWLAKGLYKWTGVRGGQNETTIFWMSIWQSFFKVTLYVSEKSRADLLRLALDKEVRLMITNSKQMGNRLKCLPLVFDLSSDELFEAIFTLIDFKKSIK